MHFKTLPKKQQAFWAKLGGVDWLCDFYLAGGTATALHLGHRQSLDFDFFSEKPFSSSEIIDKLSALGRLSVSSQAEGTFVGNLDGIRLSMFFYRYPLIYQPVTYKGIRVAQLTDIAPMKLIAIGQRGSKKDFIDLYFMLEAGWTLEIMFETLAQKFPDVQYNKMHIIKSLAFFGDAELDELPTMRKPFEWTTCKRRIVSVLKRMVGP